MITKEIIYNLKTNLSVSNSKVSSYSDQHILFMLDEARATLASQKMDGSVNVTHMAQTLDTTPIKATRGEIGEIGNSTIYKLDIPEPASFLGGQSVFTIGPTDGQESYTPISYSQLRTALYRKYTANSPKWFLLNGFIYIINADVTTREKVRVRAVFDRPIEVVKAQGSWKALDPFNWEYPLSMKDLKTVYQLSMSGDLGWGDIAAQAVAGMQRKTNKNTELAEALGKLINK